jgi:hypothetical protein
MLINSLIPQKGPELQRVTRMRNLQLNALVSDQRQNLSSGYHDNAVVQHYLFEKRN